MIATSIQHTGFFGRLLNALARSHVTAILALLLLTAAVFAPGFATMPPMDRDEPRFAQASKQMLETGNFVDIRFQTEARHKKPVGIYWLQVAAVKAGEALGVPEARTTIALYRIPSLIGAIGAVLLTYWAALVFTDRRGALLAAALLAPTILLGVEARLAKTDAVLLLTIVAMLGVLARLWMRHRSGGERLPIATTTLFWLAFAASILVKGPIGPMVVGLTLLALVAVSRQVRWLGGLRWFTGLILTALLVTPWLAAIMIQTGGTFLNDSLGQDMLAKVGDGQQSHGAPPGTYFASFWLTFWPMAPIVALAVPWVWRNRREPAVQFLLCWIIPTWLVFEIVATKLPHYVLPVFPAIAIATSLAIGAGSLSRQRWARILALLIPGLALIVPLAGLGAIVHFEGTFPFALIGFALVAFLFGVGAWRALNARRDADAVGLSALAALTVFVAVYAYGMPRLPALWPSPQLAAAVGRLGCPDPKVATLGYREPSLVFLTRTDLAMPDAAGTADFLAAGGCRMAFVEKREEEAFLARAKELSLDLSPPPRVTGINLNGGKPVDFGLYASRDARRPRRRARP